MVKEKQLLIDLFQRCGAKELAFLVNSGFGFGCMLGSMLKVPPGQRHSSAPVPLQGAPDGSGQLGTLRKRPALWAPNHCFGCSS